MRMPLEDVTVLDLSHALAVPFCSTMLADFGARVIKLEPKGAGDIARAWGPPLPGGETSYFVSLHRNKQGIEIDLAAHEFVSGGRWRYVHRGPDGVEYAFHGMFHTVRENDFAIQTFEFEGVPDGVALERMQIEDLPGGRSRLTATSLVDSFEARDAFVASGMETGVVEGYERLDEVLAEG